LEARSHALGVTLAEELTACVLVGYGVPAEIGLAAYERLRSTGVLKGVQPSEAVLRQILEEPLQVGERRLRYRFAAQKSRYIAAALRQIALDPPPLHSGRALRDALLACPGVGLKTASLIARNFLGSNDVAIVDIHVQRAGRLLGLFSWADTPHRNYLAMESRFLDFAVALDVPASMLDAVIWREMRLAGSIGRGVRTPLGSRTDAVPTGCTCCLRVVEAPATTECSVV
jgi:N-glycosylase/DNA lyase